MRLLVLYQARDAARDQPGYYNGFERLVTEGELEAHSVISYYGVAEKHGWPALWEQAYVAARQIDADAIFLQFFHGAIPDPTAAIAHLKGLSSRPVVFTSLGDPFGRWTKRISRSYRIASKLADVNFLTGMGYLAKQLARQGACNLVLMPNGCCQVRFSTGLDQAKYSPDFDVVFIGNRISSRNPLSHFFWTAHRRRDFVALVTKRYGRRFGLFGHGWTGNPSWQDPVPYEHQHSAQRRGSVVLGGMPNGYHDYYTSDRVLIAIASGIPFVDYWVPGIDLLFQPERDWWLASDLQGMLKWCDHLLSLSQEERLRLGGCARERILKFHTQYHRCREMVGIVRDLRAARSRGTTATRPQLSFLRQATKPSSAYPAAVVNWQG
jgi:Glycosyl transferases group 1